MEGAYHGNSCSTGSYKVWKGSLFRKPEFRYVDFAQFEKILIDHALKVFRSAEDYFKVSASIFRSALNQNIRYLETIDAGMIEFLNIPEEKSHMQSIRLSQPV